MAETSRRESTVDGPGSGAAGHTNADRNAGGGGTDFIRTMIAADVRAGKHGGRVATRFPPEPNGYLHIGHAKAICLNFGVAAEFGGTCNLRFDDTNPAAEDERYVDAIKRDIAWLGFDPGERIFFASDYYENLYQFAVDLIKTGNAYVDSSSEVEIRAARGTVTESGRNSPFRDRSVEENLDLFQRMRNGEFPDGSHVLRAKIDMASPNMLMRDPLLYRVRHEHHYRTGDAWCLYPLYDFAHCLSDAIEGITHSLCSLEFKDNRELYDWIVAASDVPARPEQTEFARLNIDYTVMSKRKLLTLVEEGHVSGWDDPRMPTLAGMRSRGITPEAIRRFCDMVGVARVNSRVDIAKLEYCVRDDLNHRVPRVMCVLRPLKVVLTNFPEGSVEQLRAPYYPHDVPLEGERDVPFTRDLFIERDDFLEAPPKGYYRLAPGREVRLRYGYVIRCDEVVKDDCGEVIELRCSYDPETTGGNTPDGRKVKGTIHWVSATASLPAEVRLYDRLFAAAEPEVGSDGATWTHLLNPESLVTLSQSRIEPSVAGDGPGERYQFERLGYFAAAPESGPDHLVFNRTVTLRDSWGKAARGSDDGRPARSGSSSQRPGGPSNPPPTTRRPSVDRPAVLVARAKRYMESHGLSAQEAELLTEQEAIADFFDAAVAVHADGRAVASWIVNDVFRECKDRDVARIPFDGARLGSLVALVANGTISRAIARDVLDGMIRTGEDPSVIVERQGLEQVADESTIVAMIDRALEAHPEKVAEYRQGRSGLLGFFVGQVMKFSGGTAKPQMVKSLTAARLDG